ncbi:MULTISPECIES: hypothetical protein [Mycobacterium simiae complex]|nr:MULTISPECIES: hypothetical protein [Mycobacterium simiae complex]
MTATWWQLMVPFWRLMSSTTAFLATIFATSSKASSRLTASWHASPALR